MTSTGETQSTSEPIAVVGMACRLPGARSPQELWELLCRGDNVISDIPDDRFPVEEFYHPVPGTPGKLSSRRGGFVSGVDEFDAEFFGISPREAAAMDPQHRLTMEVAWEAFEDAGLTLERMPGLTGAVFMGVITSDYWDRQSGHVGDLDVHTVTGSTRGGNAGRISYALNLTGMSVALDAACSSSLVATQLAVQSLRAGSCDLAFAGGVNLILAPDHAVGFSQGLMMAPDGQCKAFDARANGYVRSEGVGVIVLKTLTRALADGDRIHALIRGAAASNDGHSDGFMAPQVGGQQAALRAAYRDAGVDPASVAYVEAHGTGTSVGDPVEITALDGVLGAGRPQDRPLLVGSAKTNLGHTEGAAGVTGLIKSVLCVKHGWLPASLNFETPNPTIPWDQVRVRVCDRGQPWPEGEGPRRAGVSSFGITGTNVHIVVEEPPPAPERPVPDGRGPVLLPISARTREALTTLAEGYRDLLRTESASLAQVGAAAGARRSHHDHRLAVVAGSAGEAAAALDAVAAGGHPDGVHSGAADDAPAGARHKTAWVFPGQGAQWLGMGLDLLTGEPVFAEAIAECERAMRPYVDWSLTAELTASPETSRLAEVDVAQPVIFAVQVALARLWRSWGFVPDAVVGHSMGEVAAACVAGILDLDDAARIICGRSKIVRAAGGRGAMAAVELSFERARALVADSAGRVVVGVSNSPTSSVLAGDPEEVDALLRALEAEGVFGRRVQVDFASHSPQMDPLREPLLELLAPLRPRQGDVPLCSTVTGRLLTGPRMDAAYWVDNLREPVLFADAVQHLAENGFDTFVEFSPHPLLARAVRQNLSHTGADGVVVTALTRDTTGRTALLEAAAELYVTGRDVDFARIQPYGPHHVTLPAHPWRHERYWKTPRREKADGGRAGHGGTGHPIIGTALRLAPDDHLVWDVDVDLDRLTYLNDHRVHGMPMLSGTGYHELALAAGREAYRDRPFQVDDLLLERALFLTPGEPRRLQARLEAATDDGGRRWACFVAEDGSAAGGPVEWVRLATALVRPCPAGTRDGEAGVPDLAAYPEPMDAERHYAAQHDRGIEQTGPFAGVTALHRGEGAVAAELVVHGDIAADMERYIFHPALLDSAVQPVMTLLDAADAARDTYLPVRTASCRVHTRPEAGRRLWSRAVRTSPPSESDLVEFDILIGDETGRPVATIEGFQIRRLITDPPEVTEQKARRLLFGVEWTEPEPLARPSAEPSNRLVVTGSPLGPRLRAALAGDAGRAVLVQPGEGYLRVGPGHYVLDPESEDDWNRLVKEQTADGAWPPREVVHLATAGDGEPEVPQDCLTVLGLVKALTAHGGEPAPRLWLVTSGAQSPDGAGDVDPAQAAVWGLGRVIPYEHPELRCSMVDLPADPDPVTLDALCAEVASDGAETEIALRNGRRYAARLRRRALPPARPVPVRPDATYLIAGGFGGVGLLTAEWLVRHGARHLVLTGRTGAPPEAADRIAAMTAYGVEVRPATVDITSREQLADLLVEIAGCMPPLRGVVNSAVVLDDGTLAQLDRARFLAPMPPKVDGSRNLHELTRDLPLDFFLLYSSAASLIGSPGQGNYSAANAYLDGLARHRRAGGLPALSVNWGQWAGTGQVAKAGKDLRLAERGFAGFSPAEALVVLERLLADPPAQAGVMSFDPAMWTHYFPALRSSSLFHELVREDSVQDTESRLTRGMLAEQDADTAGRLVTAYLCAQVADIVQLPREKVDPAQRLHRLGIDSLMAVQLRNRLTLDLDVSLPAAVFLQGRSIGDLADAVLDHITNS
ncbi:myxalamid-type polyketide synthase MxaE and MxaD [Streptosporangium becharense]|uniref:Myxalamid-type polyketide synthase MxaE and MxaD n=1 Tax=Streptosporangium becharense TaxID=1816182 RepID=A0A7W9MEJ9_9ACTN|nr:type I polyketide synthase [Streptosporangium becharense]MBB2913804.1 myxalamid-type polyketide synthase MxaE and MxaD [Streptosporangium becharense]MBB5817885.1 myxalamid-type polyketide synthase MxaE and MxaD [Streptosporangium becharense]